MESLSSSRINKILLQTPVKGLFKPLGSRGTAELYHVSPLWIHSISMLVWI